MTAKIVGTDIVGVVQLFGGIDSISVRLESAKNYLPHSALPQDLRDKCAKAIDEMRVCNAFRNKLAHGHYEIDNSTSVLHLTAFSTTTKRNVVSQQLTEALLQDELTRVRSLTNFITNDIGF